MLGLDTEQSLRDVLILIKNGPQPDIIVASGDISNDAGKASYERFVTIYNEIFPTIPLAWLPGNHDLPSNMDVVSRRPIERQHTINGWNLIFLDSRIPKQEGGNLPQHELNHLEACLNESPLPTMIFLHHQPVAVGSKWIDSYIVDNAEAFFDVTDQYQHVKSIAWGHVHQDFYTTRNGVELYATPSTCFQFAPKSEDFRLDSTMPGYRSFVMHRDGRIESHVERIADQSYTIDYAATGY